MVTPSCVFTIQLSGNIDLTASTTAINNNTSGTSLVIEGSGKTVDGKNIDGVRPFHIQTNTAVTMNDLTVRGGKVTGNGTANRGGGILNESTLTLNRSTVAGNSVETRGGGIANQDGTVEINESTIADNTAGTTLSSGSGGGIYSEGNSASSITIRNSTISGNGAGEGGGIKSFANLTLDSVTITNNGAVQGSGIDFSTLTPAVLTIKNTILAGNTLFDCYKDGVGATITDQGHNLVGTQHPSPNSCGFVNGVNNNILGNPKLDPLADNGGPTQTHAPKLDSPVINAGNTALTTDQRGVARPAGSADDIGAFESLACEDDAWYASNRGELAAAIDCFNAKTSPGAYHLVLTQNIGLNQALPAISNATSGVSLVIEGNRLGVEGFTGFRVFLIETGTKVTMNDLLVQGGILTGAERGAGIRNLGDLAINRSTITQNKAEESGAGISNRGTLVINDSTISDNELDGGTGAVVGGGIANEEGTLTISNSTISRNKSSNDGGGIGNFGALNLESVTVTANSASGASAGAGAGVFVGSFGTLTVQNSILAGNTGADDCYTFLPITDGGHNLVQTQYNCGFTDGVNGNIVGQPAQLGPLHNNGGPTKTHALLVGSPAIDAGDTSLTKDQRGWPRPAGPSDDIGAFEEAQLGQLTIVKTANPADGTDFNFTLSGGNLAGPIPFTLDDDGTSNDGDGITNTQSFHLPAGAYSVTEEVLPGQILGPVAITCVDNAGPIGSFSGATANIPLQAYQDVTCTFSNDTIYWVTATAVGSGFVSCSPTFVGKGKSSTCTAVPDAGFQVKEWTGACADVGSSPQCYLSKIVEDKTSTVVFEINPDSDNDGVPNESDLCPNTPSGDVVDKNGCSIEQLCKCDQARNHGQYVSCVAHTANAFVSAGLIGQQDKGKIIAKAAQSQCGK